MRRALVGFSVLLLVVAFIPVAFAGGWAISVFDDPPAEFVAGETYELTYQVLQHGESPVDVQSTSVILKSSEDGRLIEFPGAPTGEQGRYMVEVSIPESGTWHWEVTQTPFDAQDLGPLPIVPAGSLSLSADDLLRVLLPLATLGSAVLLALQVADSRRSSRLAQSGPSAAGG